MTDQPWYLTPAPETHYMPGDTDLPWYVARLDGFAEGAEPCPLTPTDTDDATYAAMLDVEQDHRAGDYTGDDDDDALTVVAPDMVVRSDTRADRHRLGLIGTTVRITAHEHITYPSLHATAGLTLRAWVRRTYRIGRRAYRLSPMAARAYVVGCAALVGDDVQTVR